MGAAASRRAPRCRAPAARAPRRRRAPRPARGRTGAAGRSRTRPGPPPTAGCGTFSGRSIRPTWSTKTRSAPERDGPAERDRVHDAAVEEVLAADLGRRQQPGYGGAGHDRVDEPAAVEPVLGGPLDAGRAHLEPDRQLLEGRVAELLDAAAAAAARRSRGGCRSSTARRTVRSGRSPRPRARSRRPCHSSVSRSITAGVGSRATIAPFRAPTLVPSTRSGVMSRSNSARSMPTSAAPSTPPPPSTNAVVMRSAATRRAPARGARRGSAGRRGARPRRSAAGSGRRPATSDRERDASSGSGAQSRNETTT